MTGFIDSTFSISGKSIAVTGCNGQLGGVICDALSKAGAIVEGADIQTRTDHENIHYTQVDIADLEAVKGWFSNVKKRQKELHGLINNAGVSTFESFEERPTESFDWVMDVNLKGTYFCIREFYNNFKNTAPGKSIVNIASMYGFVSPDYRIYTDCHRKNSEVYGATKAGVIQMTKYFAVHLAEKDFRVNAISPGGIYNPASPQGDDFLKSYSSRCPMKRMANAKEMVGAVVFLLSSSASYITGQNIAVDGGFSAW
jgi:NAD(P)-dependent dehydrogenase (short-subunit alcohol dehydrogenase family)